LAATATPAAAQHWHDHGGGGWGGGGFAAGFVPGLALGALAARPYYYPSYGSGYYGPAYYSPGYPYAGYGYGNCYIQRQPVVDAYGRYMGSRKVRVCD
jgi:hypothetical protein